MPASLEPGHSAHQAASGCAGALRHVSVASRPISRRRKTPPNGADSCQRKAKTDQLAATEF